MSRLLGVRITISGDLKLSSLNKRGLGEVSKREEISNCLRKKKFSIYMLQGAHCTENNFHLWTGEWEYKGLFSSSSSFKAGTCILFKNNFDLQINKTRSDHNGRFIICDINTNGTSFTLFTHQMKVSLSFLETFPTICKISNVRGSLLGVSST